MLPIRRCVDTLRANDCCRVARFGTVPRLESGFGTPHANGSAASGLPPKSVKVRSALPSSLPSLRDRPTSAHERRRPRPAGAAFDSRRRSRSSGRAYTLARLRSPGSGGLVSETAGDLRIRRTPCASCADRGGNRCCLWSLRFTSIERVALRAMRADADLPAVGSHGDDGPASWVPLSGGSDPRGRSDPGGWGPSRRVEEPLEGGASSAHRYGSCPRRKVCPLMIVVTAAGTGVL